MTEKIHAVFNSCYPQGITTIDSHTAGEYTRLIVEGTGSIHGRTMAEKRQCFMDSLDWVRKILTREPRGNRDIVAAVLTEPVSEKADFGLIYMDARRYPYLCGHATIGAVTTLINSGLLNVNPDDQGIAQVIVDTPSGPMPTRVEIVSKRAARVSFTSVPCFVYQLDIPLQLSSGQTIIIDLVCAGGFFALVNLDQPYFEDHNSHEKLINLGMEITDKACERLNVCHPERPEVNSVDVTEFYRHTDKRHGQSIVVYGEFHMDRSPCGTGTAAKMALLSHKGRLDENDEYINKGPLKTEFKARLVEKLTVGDYPAVRVKISGSAHITGFHKFIIEKEDPFPEGFVL